MTLSALKLGRRPDTNLQKHVRDKASLDVVGDIEKMTLTNKLVFILKYIQSICSLSPPFCVTVDIEDSLFILHQLSLTQSDIQLAHNDSCRRLHVL